MGWVVQTIVKLILKAVCGLFSGLAVDFVATFGLNVGSDFSTLTTSKSLASVLAAYNNKAPSVFDTLFPMSEFKKIFMILALTIATALFMKELILAIASPLSGNRRQHPATSVAKFVGTIVGIILSYRLFLVLEYIMNEFYIKIANTSITLMNTIDGQKPGTPLKDIFANSAGGGVGDVLYIAAQLNPTTSIAEGIGELILNLVIVYLLLVNLIKLLLEILERYIVVGVLFYTSPLAFSSLASNDTSDIFKSWLRMSVSEMILVATNSIFICIFFGALGRMNNIFANNQMDGGFIGEVMLMTTRLSWMLYMLLLLAWLLFAQRLDSYLNSLGLSTAQTGGTLGAAVIAGAAAVAGGVGSLGGKALSSTALKASRQAGLNPLKSWDAAAKGGIDTAKAKGGNLIGTATGTRPKGSQDAADRLNAIQATSKAADGLRQNGHYDDAKNLERFSAGAIPKDKPLTQDAKDSLTRNTLEASGNGALANSMRPGSAQLNRDASGRVSMSWSDKEAGNASLAVGGDMTGKHVIGGVGGASIGMSGDAKMMEKAIGTSGIQQSLSEGLTSFGSSATAGYVTSNGQQMAGARVNGQLYQSYAEGSTNIPSITGAIPLSTGETLVPTQGTFQSPQQFAESGNRRSALIGRMEAKQYACAHDFANAIPKMDTDQMNALYSYFQPASAAQRVIEACSNRSFDPTSLTMSISTDDGGEAIIDLSGDRNTSFGIPIGKNSDGSIAYMSMVNRGDSGYMENQIQAMIDPEAVNGYATQLATESNDLLNMTCSSKDIGDGIMAEVTGDEGKVLYEVTSAAYEGILDPGWIKSNKGTMYRPTAAFFDAYRKAFNQLDLTDEDILLMIQNINNESWD